MEFHRLPVAEVTRLCDDAAAITFDVPAELAAAYDFRAGQSLTIRRGNGIDERRSYSVCAAQGDRLRIGVRVLPGGLFSPWLVHDVRRGDRIEVGTPTGMFTPDLKRPGHHAFVAAGSGITPVLSVAASVLRDPASTAILFYGNRRVDTVMFADELADLKDRCPTRFELVHVLSREAREAELFTGRLDAARLATLFDALTDVREVGHWWLCGPFGMVTDAMSVLAKYGVPREKIHQELFFVEDQPWEPVRHNEPGVAGAASEVTVVLDGRATTVTMPRDMSILDGAHRSRPDLPFACKGGVCGTCRAKVTGGKVHLRRNFALEEQELAAGFVLTCQSRPESDRVTVDYDV